MGVSRDVYIYIYIYVYIYILIKRIQYDRDLHHERAKAGHHDLTHLVNSVL